MLDQSPPAWPHFTLVAFLKVLSSNTVTWRCWKLGLQHTDFGWGREADGSAHNRTQLSKNINDTLKKKNHNPNKNCSTILHMLSP